MAGPLKVSLGIDVGTGSARCGVFTLDGRLLGSHACDTQTWTPKPHFYEQSADDIWRCCCTSARAALAAAQLSSEASTLQVVGVGFDATCSLVVLGAGDVPLSVDPCDGDPQKNVILWLDHRATEQAARINDTKHPLLSYVGGAVSPEMEMPKLLWLKEHLPSTYNAAAKFFDLTDYLTSRATGVDVRSLCTTVCKWNYDANPSSESGDRASLRGWDAEFLAKINLSDLEVARIGADVRPVGSLAGTLCASAAADLGLAEGTAVAVGAIDAHAGGIGCLGSEDAADGGPSCLADVGLEARLALISGTSTCHMASSAERVFVPGVWGPYFSAMVPGLYLNEGGQSAAGKLLDFLVEGHPRYPELAADAVQRGLPPTALLNERLERMASAAGLPPNHSALLARAVHVTPDFAGNRSPLADPGMRGAVVGLELSNLMEDLCRLYLAAVQALAYQTRHIVDVMEAAGHEPIRAVVVTGGLAKNSLYVREHADALGRPLCLPAEKEAVLLGSAMLGAAAGGAFGSVPEAMRGMSASGSLVRPSEDAEVRALHGKKYGVHRRMAEDQRAYREMMADAVDRCS